MKQMETKTKMHLKSMYFVLSIKQIHLQMYVHNKYNKTK